MMDIGGKREKNSIKILVPVWYRQERFKNAVLFMNVHKKIQTETQKVSTAILFSLFFV